MIKNIFILFKIGRVLSKSNTLNYFDEQIDFFKKKSISSLKQVQEFGLKHDLLIFDGNSIVDQEYKKSQLE